MNVSDSIFDTTGNTPLLRLTKIIGDLPAEILAKLEFFNPSGSIKDRILFRMVDAAERRGLLAPGMTIIEGSTGNTGISTAMTAAVKGYPCIIVMPEGMSIERQKAIQAYGARLILTPGGESDVDLVIEKVAEVIGNDRERYWKVGQFENFDNVQAHLDTTGPEVWKQTDGQVAAFVASQGTGGTITGVGKYLKEMDPGIKVYAVEPAECPTLSKGIWGSHLIEGIGDGFIPQVFDVQLLDGVITVSSEESIEMAKRLAREEGLFCGVSSGCNVAASIKLAKRYPDLAPIVTMIPDDGRRYFSTELCGEKREHTIPDRVHELDRYSIDALEKYQKGWEIIE